MDRFFKNPYCNENKRIMRYAAYDLMVVDANVPRSKTNQNKNQFSRGMALPTIVVLEPNPIADQTSEYSTKQTDEVLSNERTIIAPETIKVKIGVKRTIEEAEKGALVEFISETLHRSLIAMIQKARSNLVEILNQILIKCGPDSFDLGFDVYEGAAGIAFLFYKLHLADASNTFVVNGQTLTAISISKLYIDEAFRKAQILPKNAYECGLIKSVGGVYCVAALVYNELKITLLAKQALLESAKMIDVVDEYDSHNELYYGKSGYLYSLQLLRSRLPNADAPPLKASLALQHQLLISGESGAQRRFNEIGDRDAPKIENLRCRPKCSLLWSWHMERYNGAAHGTAGIIAPLLNLFQELQALESRQEAEQCAFDDVFRALTESLQYLSKRQRVSNGNYNVRVDDDPQTSSQLDHSTELVQFCHGATGIGMLMCKAYEVLHDTSYLLYARDIAELIWERGLLKKGVGLCHGIAGNGYIFLALHKITGEDIYRERADKFMDILLDGTILSADASHSKDAGLEEKLKIEISFGLYEGLAGVACFLVDLAYPEQFKGFPLYTDI